MLPGIAPQTHGNHHKDEEANPGAVEQAEPRDISPPNAGQANERHERKGAPASERYGIGHSLLVVVAAASPSPVEEATDAVVPQCLCH